MALGENLKGGKKPVKKKGEKSIRPKPKGESKELVQDKDEKINTGHLEDVLNRITRLPEEILETEEKQISGKMMCIFQAGMEEYAVPLETVKEVIAISPIAPLPQVPEFIVGMANVRGNVHGILDLNIFFQNKAGDVQNRFLLVLNHDEYKIAIQIPEVPDTMLIDEDNIEDFSSSMMNTDKNQDFLSGLIKMDGRMIIQLNILELISSERLVAVN